MLGSLEIIQSLQGSSHLTCVSLIVTGGGRTGRGWRGLVTLSAGVEGAEGRQRAAARGRE